MENTFNFLHHYTNYDALYNMTNLSIIILLWWSSTSDFNRELLVKRLPCLFCYQIRMVTKTRIMKNHFFGTQ